jgi:hypothetical protein
MAANMLANSLPRGDQQQYEKAASSRTAAGDATSTNTKRRQAAIRKGGKQPNGSWQTAEQQLAKMWPRAIQGGQWVELDQD